MVENPAQSPRIRDVVLTISPPPPPMSIVLGRIPSQLLLTLIQPSSEVDYTFASLPRTARMVGGNNRGVVIMSQKGWEKVEFPSLAVTSILYDLHISLYRKRFKILK